MTHADLVRIAERWLWGGARSCHVVFREFVTYAGEVPDAIGFDGSHSIVVECKASRADFRADVRKWHRRNGQGMGTLRFYLTPKGMVEPSEVPPGWGLLETSGGRMRMVKRAQPREPDLRAERRLLVSGLRRLALRGHLPDVYAGMNNLQEPAYVEAKAALRRGEIPRRRMLEESTVEGQG